MVRDSALFDDDYYLDCNDDVAEAGIDALRHYLTHGGFEGRNPNPWFHSGWYLARNPHLAVPRINPLVHFLARGAAEGRNPHPDFDIADYRRAHPQVDFTTVNPLTHFLGQGGRHPERAAPRPTAPPWGRFVALGTRRCCGDQAAPATLDVIVPVYRGYNDTLACLYSVLSAEVETDFELIVIDDASPDPALADMLVRLADLGLITLVRNPRNLGFVASVNRGVALHPDRDILLLNSDTEVYGNWLDRMAWHGRQPDVATVTPFSNNATICSYPIADQDNQDLPELTYSDLDGLAAAANARDAVDIPTGVGFCLYITRAAWAAVGNFDERTFGKGYGEENDFCLRARQAGYRNLMALDVFVRHTGAVSFGADARATRIRNQALIRSRYPDYARLLRAHAMDDPAAPARRRIDTARLRRYLAGRRVTVAVTHARGGGIETVLTLRAAALSAAGGALIAVRPDGDGARGQIGTLDALDLPNLRGLDMTGAPGGIVDVLGQLGVAHVEVHSTVGWPIAILDRIPRIAAALGVTYSVILHDYVPVCPQINFVRRGPRYCGEPEDAAPCNRCLSRQSHPWTGVHGPPTAVFPDGRPDIAAWRRRYGGFLKTAAALSAPSRDTVQRFARYFPDLTIACVPHPPPVRPPDGRGATTTRAADGPFRVAVIGAIGPHKGAQVLLGSVRAAYRAKRPLTFVVVGYTCMDRAFRRFPNCTITGAYRDDQVFEILRGQRPDLVFLPSIWPETFCFTLSIALDTGLPVAVFDIGAQAQRVRAAGRANGVLPLSLADRPAALNTALTTLARQGRMSSDPPRMLEKTTG